MAEHRPDVVVVERVFAQQNVRTVTGTAQAAGLAMVAAARHGIAVHLHTPSEVKAAITGSGTADKAQVTAMVTRILKLDVAPTPADAADALALAICHLWRGAAQARLEAAVTHARAGARAPRPRTTAGRFGRTARSTPMIASVHGRVAALGPGRCRRRGGRRRAGRVVLAGNAGPAAGR